MNTFPRATKKTDGEMTFIARVDFGSFIAYAKKSAPKYKIKLPIKPSTAKIKAEILTVFFTVL